MLPLHAALAVAALLLLVLRFKLPAFLALLLVSAGFGLLAGMDGQAVLASMQTGMGGTLGFIAVVVGLGSMFGALLEAAGGVRVVADGLLRRAGPSRATWALGAVGFLIAIPVFFDVAFVLLAPLVLRLAASSRRNVWYFATPLLAGLAVAHAFIPPTPGPIAVAQLLKADLGWVIVMGVACGVPAMIVAGPLFALRFRRLPYGDESSAPLVGAAVGVRADRVVDLALSEAVVAVLLPLALIVGNTVGKQWLPAGTLRDWLGFLGHPFAALLLAVLYAYSMFGVRRRLPPARLREIMTGALEPAGIVVLVTGAGGVFKQVLIDSGAGRQLGELFSRQALPPLLVAFLIALLVRLAQGSATVAMITAAGLVAPIVAPLRLDAPQTALVVIAIASGATCGSHVNDSGFWLVSRYLGQSELATLRGWTVASLLVGVVGFLSTLAIAALI